MGLNVCLNRVVWISYDEGKTYESKEEEVYSGGTTHNLTEMADEAGIYEALWRPHRLRYDYDSNLNDNHNAEYEFEAKQTIRPIDIIDKLEKGLKTLKENPEHFEKFNSPNGWGLYKHFVPFVESYLNACKEYPNAIIEVSR